MLNLGTIDKDMTLEHCRPGKGLARHLRVGCVNHSGPRASWMPHQLEMQGNGRSTHA